MRALGDERVITLLDAPETRGDFAQLLILFLPPRFQCPREDLFAHRSQSARRLPNSPCSLLE